MVAALLLLLLLAGPALAGEPAPTATPAATPDPAAATARLIAELDNPDWPTRVQATAALKRRGKPALPQLEAALPGASTEAEWRLREILAAVKDEEWVDEALEHLRREEWAAAAAALATYAAHPRADQPAWARAREQEVRLAFLDENTVGTLARAVAIQNLYTMFRARGEARPGLFALSRAAFQAVLRQEPEAPDALLGLASLLAEAGEYAEARRVFAGYDNNRPPPPERRSIAGLLNEAYYYAALSEDDGSPELALSLLRQAVEANPAELAAYLATTDDFHHLADNEEFQRLLAGLAASLAAPPERE